ncbi:putative NRPS-like protein biosynthetic cluster [Marasmius oreades]|uniref:NRPS-like protein biosynthetic cluster n=1 Tax=Marasmius oreades TaxID=181124 RepID=A0A9P7RS57_9AGAR|nr:putative NRPS-like protein biosynthetic cluster [Marasmius oreades]KAG7088662.1 putative NRPS-like protein biosynthetic cluster [Marasmius oreades]
MAFQPPNLSLQPPAVHPDLDTWCHFPDLVHFHWSHNPTRTMYAYPDDSVPVTGCAEISYTEFGRAAHRAAWAIRPDPHDSRDGEVVALLAQSDTLVYQAVTIGMMTANLVPLDISPRNSPAAILNLLQKTGCHRLLVTQHTLKDLIDSLRSFIASQEGEPYQVAFEEIPSLSQTFPHLAKETPSTPGFTPYPTLEKPDFHSTAIYIHSSGSTGFPKPIPLTHRGVWSYANLPPLREHRDHVSLSTGKKTEIRLGGLAIPAFHALALILQLIHPMFGGFSGSLLKPTVVDPTRDLPSMPTPENTLDAFERTSTNATMIFPTFLQIWSKEPQSVKRLAKLEYVVLTGGPLDVESGDALVREGVKLRTIYGGTEFGQVNHLRARPGDEEEWQWMEFNESRVGVRWLDAGANRGEIVLLHTETHMPAISNLPEDVAKKFTDEMNGVLEAKKQEVDFWVKGIKPIPMVDTKTGLIKGYSTSDVWERHPTKPWLFKLVGRVDDVLIHSSGEKTVPGPMEKIVMESPLIKGAVIFGHGRAQPGILVEPSASALSQEMSLGEFRNAIWPHIDAANAIAPAFSRIYKEMIIVTEERLPLARTPKDTVIRKMSIKQYEGEIDTLYETIETNSGGSGSIEPPSSWDIPTVEAWIVDQAHDITSSSNPLSPTEDLFDWGFDSLSATILRLRIAGALKATKGKEAVVAKVNQNTIYVHHTVNMLAQFVCGTQDGPIETEEEEHIRKMEEMIEKYSAGLEDGDIPMKSQKGEGQHTVLLTGSTGSLGSHILFDLIRDTTRVNKIYALNRSPSAPEKQKEKFADKGLDAGVLKTNRVVYLTQNQDPLPSDIDVVIHNAWKLDFNFGLEGFEGSVKDLRGLIDHVKSLNHNARFLFTGSISAAHAWKGRKGCGEGFPEKTMEAKYAVGGGYGEAKYVCERILDNSGIEATSFRIGQITGSKESPAWSETDWVPIIVKSSLEMGVIPDAAGVVSWIPSHIVSSTILDIAFADRHEPAVNIVHPRPVKWTEVMKEIKEALEDFGVAKSELKVVPYKEWFSILEKKAEAGASSGAKAFEKIPAIKLLHFYRGQAVADEANRLNNGDSVEAVDLQELTIENARKLSKAFRDAPPVGREDVRAWVKYWVSKGF